MVAMDEFDGCTELYVKTWGDFLSLVGSEKYKGVAADAANFIEGPLHVVCYPIPPM